MTTAHLRQEIRSEIKSITVQEFRGIDHLPDDALRLKPSVESRKHTPAGEKVRTGKPEPGK
jgi:hypothetical protein